MIDQIRQLLAGDAPFRLAIDGRCGAGKTTLADILAKELDCAVIHLDDFFLPKGKDKIGFGNLEKDRLIGEVLLPLSRGKNICYRKFSCAKQTYSEPITVSAERSVILEGSYALLPEFRFAYTHSIFLTVSAKEQKRRLLKRCGDEGWSAFETRWIPDEEACFAACGNEACADLVLKT